MKRRNFSINSVAKTYAWCLRRLGYETEIDYWEDDYLTGIFLCSGYEVKGKRM